MSLSKVQSFDDNYRRDSFSHRVCDDLSEVILQFLSFKDKFRFECVSKQFQRTVFQRHFDLELDEIDKIDKVNPNAVEIILKKLPNIKSLSQRRFESIKSLEAKTIDLMVKYCNHLTEINCHLSDMSDTTQELFVSKFGSKISSICVINNDLKRLGSLQNSFPNIRQLSYLSFLWKLSPLLHRFYSSFIPFLEDVSHLKNMSKISVRLYRNDFEKQTEDLQTFVANNRSLTHFAVLFETNDRILSEFVFNQISSLHDLVELEFYEINEFSEELKKIGVNCRKLKSLTIRLITGEESQIESIFSGLKIFKRLQRLSINCIEYHSGVELILNSSLRQMNDLTHLKLGFPTFPFVLLKDSLLTDFDKYLPKLQTLYIKNIMNASEGTADILSRLLRLESFVLFVSNHLIQKLIESKVMKSCPLIKCINCLPQLTGETELAQHSYKQFNLSNNNKINNC